MWYFIEKKAHIDRIDGIIEERKDWGCFYEEFNDYLPCSARFTDSFRMYVGRKQHETENAGLV